MFTIASIILSIMLAASGAFGFPAPDTAHVTTDATIDAGYQQGTGDEQIHTDADAKVGADASILDVDLDADIHELVSFSH